MFRRWICVVTTTAGRGRQKFGFQYEWVMTFAELFISAVRPVVIIYMEDHYSYLPGSSGTLSFLNIHTWHWSDYILLCPICPLSNKSVCSRWPSLAPLPHFIYFLSFFIIPMSSFCQDSAVFEIPSFPVTGVWLKSSVARIHKLWLTDTAPWGSFCVSAPVWPVSKDDE